MQVIIISKMTVKPFLDNPINIKLFSVSQNKTLKYALA